MKYIKISAIFTLLLAVFIPINTSLDFKINEGFIEAVIFAMVTELLIFQPKIKFLILIISNILFTIMVVFFLFGHINSDLMLIDTANTFASLGFGMLILSVIFYLPQIFKRGYISEI